MNDGEHYTTMSDGKILEFSYGTGEQTAVVFDSKQQQPVLPFTDYAFSSDERRILLTTEVKPIYRRSFTAEYLRPGRRPVDPAFGGRAAAGGAIFARCHAPRICAWE